MKKDNIETLFDEDDEFVKDPSLDNVFPDKDDFDKDNLLSRYEDDNDSKETLDIKEEITSDVSIKKEEKHKKMKLWQKILVIFICLALILGSFLGYFAGNIYAQKNNIFDPGIGHTLTMSLETITFVPGIVSIFIGLYKKKKIGKVLTIIYMLGTIFLFQTAFFLLLVNM